MRHLVFVDSTAVGLTAFETANRFGHKVTFVRPRDLCLAEMQGLSPTQLAAAFANVDRQLEVDTLYDQSLQKALKALHAADPIDALITVSELAVVPLAEAAEALGVPSSSYKAICTAVYKDRCRAHLAEHGIRTARYNAVNDLDTALQAAQEIGYPVIVKPARSSAKLLSALCYTENDIRSLFVTATGARADMHPVFQSFVSMDFVVEERLIGPLYSAEVGMSNGTYVPLVVTGRTQASHDELVEIGAFMPSGLSANDTQAVFDYVEHVLKSIGLTTGLFHVEVIMTSEGPALVEINPRMMGGTLPQMYSYVTQADPFEVLISAHLGTTIDVQRLTPRRSAVSLAVGALNETIAPDDVLARLEDLYTRYDLFENTLKVTPGQLIPKFVGNFTALGRVGLAAPDYTSAVALGRRFITDLGVALKCAMATY